MFDLRGHNLPHMYDEAQSALSRRLSHLARDASGISRSLEKFGAGAGRDVSHFAHDATDAALHHGASAARVIGKQAWRAGKAVRRDPVPAVVAVAGLACILSLIMSSDKRR